MNSWEKREEAAYGKQTCPLKETYLSLKTGISGAE